jgi:hypothetical protein
MNNHLGRHLKTRREELGLGRGQLARSLGYTNISKGCRRILDAEEGRTCTAEFLARLTHALGIEPRVVQGWIDRDRREFVEAWERWADEPVPIRVVARLIPGVFGTIELPPDATTREEAVAFAEEKARRLGKKVFVLLSRRETLCIDEGGVNKGSVFSTPGQDAAPGMRLGSKRFLHPFTGNSLENTGSQNE